MKCMVLPETLENIPNFSFQSDTGLKDIEIPKTVKKIGQRAFYNCGGLEKLSFEKENTALTIAFEAFKNCSSLKEIEFPKNIAFDSTGSFANCTSLESLDMTPIENIPDTGSKVFDGSSALKSIKLPTSNTVTKLPEAMFENCEGIKNVTIPSNFTNFKGFLFAHGKVEHVIYMGKLADNGGAESMLRGNDIGSNKAVIYTTALEDTAWSKFGAGGTGIYNDSDYASLQINGVLNGGMFPEGTNFTVGSLDTPVREGYKFKGWYKNTDSGLATEPTTENFETCVYVAQWASTVTFDANGGELENNSVDVMEGQPIGTLPTPTKEGYTFGGWYTAKGNGEKVTADTVPTGNATYYARWTKVITDGENQGTYYVNPIVGDVVYTGAELKPAIEVYKNGTKIEDTTEYTVTYTNNRNVGVATAMVTVGGIEIGTANFNITKATPIIKITPSVTTQRGAGTVTLTVTKPETATGAVTVKCDNGITVDEKDGVYTAALPNTTRTYTFTAAYAGDGNYNAAEDATCTVDVTRKKSSSSSDTSAPTYSVSTGKTENGEISVTPEKAEAGEKVTIKATPDSGYQLDKVTVKDKNNSNVKLTKVSDNEYTFTMPSGKVSVDATFVQKDATDDNQNNAGEKSKVIKLQIGSRIVTVDNEAVIYDVAPVIRNDRTLVPIRIVTETLGGKVDWNGVTKEVTLNIDGKEIKMTVGKTLEKYGVAPVIIDGRTFVPVRFVADELGATVAWDDATKTVTITKIEK